ncbi:hypothetical protein ARMSODRAFT_184772 [Armillaria solidipes]|uniref:Uncharacterized protein n=1 Tax=Armillaria solidipes TaxID=1076256 RepID=A0A2H3C026_9AGAR|nr:hypothetical protein ARMSODRAFT_184772 [Armillaria solidipes]
MSELPIIKSSIPMNESKRRVNARKGTDRAHGIQTKPNLAFLPYHNHPDALDAYNVCLEFEKSAPPDSAALVYARTLGYLAHALGQTFIYYLIRPCRAMNPRRISARHRKTIKGRKISLLGSGVVSGKYDQTTLSEVSAPTDEIEEAGVVCTHRARVLVS